MSIRMYAVVLTMVFFFFPLPTRATTATLSEKLEGWILLQVEDHGEAWYVNPDDGLRYYMRDGEVAYEMMRSFSLGVTDADLATVPQVGSTTEMEASTSACAPGSIQQRLAGEILLRVEAHGEAWYVYPETCRAIYLPDGDAAYEIMRFLSLGITTVDLEQIETGEIPGFPEFEAVCEPGYVLGADVYCHPKCGDTETYCAGDSTCFQGECVRCDSGYYLAEDGYCYSLENLSCDPGYLLGADGLCHPACGESGTYCTDGSECLNGECLVCDEGYYLATDGYCYPEDGGESYVCGPGYVLGEDDYCYPECGDGTYCADGWECYDDECVSCDPGYYLGVDGYCYPEGNDDGYYTCDPGYVLGDDYFCYPECGSGTYCAGDSQCFSGSCVSCDPGYYLGTDGYCYPEDEGSYYSCESGYVLGEDGYCHPECGSGTYCAGDSQCFSGSCVSCDPGYYLGTDGYCYPEEEDEYDPCYPGYVYGEDGLCHEECGDGFYCTGSSVCLYGECRSCDPGYYVGTDGYCYPY